MGNKRDLHDVKVALWGFGNQIKLMAKYLHERHVLILHHDIGKDYTTVDLGVWGKKIGGDGGVKIVDEHNAKATLLDTRTDICVICTRSTLKDIRPFLTVCAESQVNVVTICEEAVFARPLNPTLTDEMDALFRENNVTLTGSGMDDGAVCEKVLMTVSSLMHRIDGIEGSEQYNLNDSGLVLAEEHGVGLTPAQFQIEIEDKASSQYLTFFSTINHGTWDGVRFGSHS